MTVHRDCHKRNYPLKHRILQGNDGQNHASLDRTGFADENAYPVGAIYHMFCALVTGPVPIGV